MQHRSLRHKKCRLGSIPVIDSFMERLGLERILVESLGHVPYAQAILLLTKNVLIDRNALYAVEEWAKEYAPDRVYGGRAKDHTLARALDRLFEIDRASFLTRVVLAATRGFQVKTDRIHNDSTSVKVFGTYEHQHPKAVRLKHGHSKDHRPDLKQLVYSLCISSDGAIPVHFKTYDGNRTDDTTHWETWQTLRGIFSRSDFLYVADSKLCTSETLRNIDRAQGKFITILPRTRAETEEFAEQVYHSRIRWEKVYARRSSRKHGRIDTFELAEGLFQMREGFRIYWFRSSEKVKRDLQEREDRIDSALSHLKALADPKRKGPKTEKALRRRADKILSRYKVQKLITLEMSLEQVEQFKQKSRGRATTTTDYRKILKWAPRLTCKTNPDAVARAAAMDGIFPLVTNTELSPGDVLKSYKYQPKVEKRHSLLKSGLRVAPIFLKKNDRIDALMVVYFLAQLLAALIERELRNAMLKKGVPAIALLPEERPSAHPTTEQVFRIFDPWSRYELYQGKKRLRTFSDPLSSVQKQVLKLLGLPLSIYA